MSIKYIDDNIIDIYLKKALLKNIDFNDREKLEEYLKKIFITLNNNYYLTIEGFYNITIYIDKYYGIVLHMEREDLEYYDYFKGEVDMRLSLVDTEFLYLVNDIPNTFKNKVEIIIKNNNIYLKIIKSLSEFEMMNLLENSILVYK